MTVLEFEQAIMELEKVRVVVRAPYHVELQDYDFERCAMGDSSVAEWLERRVFPRLDGHGIAIIDGRGRYADRMQKLHMLRRSYM